MKNISIHFVWALVLALAVAGCGPKDGTEDFNAGVEAFNQHNLEKAGRHFARSLELTPGNVDALVYLAKTRLDLGDLVSATAAISNATELAGDDLDIVLLGAEIAWHAKDYALSRRLYVSVAEDAACSPEDQARGWSGVGVVEMTCENRDLARIAFLRALRLNRKNAPARYHLGVLYADTFHFREAALEQFEAFVRLAETSDRRVEDVQRNLIPALHDEIQKAAASRPGAAGRNSEAAAALIAKAESAWKARTYKTAKLRYQEALAADPLSYKAALGLAESWEKTDATKLGQQKAFEFYRTACLLKPGAISIYLKTGEMAARQGRHMEAGEIFSRLVAADPTNLSAIDGLIRALRKTGGQAKVADAYQKYRDLVYSTRTRKK